MRHTWHYVATICQLRCKEQHSKFIRKANFTKYLSSEADLRTQLPGSTASVDVFDGVIGVLTEVPAKKISSEEETWSGKSLMIFYNNWLGAYSQLAPFARMVRAALGVRHCA